jgi:hypothetical protein
MSEAHQLLNFYLFKERSDKKIEELRYKKKSNKIVNVI